MSGRAVSSIRSIEMELRARVILTPMSVRLFRGGEEGRGGKWEDGSGKRGGRGERGRREGGRGERGRGEGKKGEESGKERGGRRR